MVNCIYHHLSNLYAAKQSATGSPFAGYNFQNWKWKSERSKNLHGKDEPKEERWRNLFVGLVWGLEKKSWVECLTFWNSQCQWIHCSWPVALISQGYIFCDILQISVILVYYDILLLFLSSVFDCHRNGHRNCMLRLLFPCRALWGLTGAWNRIRRIGSVA